MNLTIKNKISRLNAIKRNLETKNFTSIYKAAEPLKRDGIAVRVLSEIGLVEKREDGFYYWVGGSVDKELAEKFFKSINEKRRGNNIQVTQEPIKDERPYQNEDVANMIEEFIRQIRKDRMEILSAVESFNINEGIGLIKAELFDLRGAINNLASRINENEKANLAVVETLKDNKKVKLVA